MFLTGKRRVMQRMKGINAQNLLHSVLFGCINGIMCIPIMISFTSIIFRDDAYREALPSLVKIVLFSCMIHQISFSIFSGLTFAVGQVQDAGLIFLSAMATSIVEGCKSPEDILPTTLVVLSIYTALLGAMLILLGKLKLASVVQYLPLPVVGGYLAYIGFFCGQAGLAMMAGVEISSPSEWTKLFNMKTFILILPGIILGCSQYMLLRVVKSPFTLPVCMVVMLIGFYSIISATGMTLQDARDDGWIAALAPEIAFYKAWNLFSFGHVDWAMFLPQFPKFFGMVLVVSFSSSLDVAAIEMELGLPLDYNRELQTVGISNLFSGILGGYTGSYIFSQTLFSLRRGVKSRVAGAVLAMCELIIILLPISVTSYLPKMFFGSMLVLISVDLMWEWLVVAAAKMMVMEYAVCLATFLAIMIGGIETGMAIGVLLSMISFVIVYAKLPALSSSSLLLRSSTVVRSYEERCALLSRANRGKIVTITLKGYVFFGSAVKILEEVKSRVILTPAAAMTEEDVAQAHNTSSSVGDSSSEVSTPMFSFLMGDTGKQNQGQGQGQGQGQSQGQKGSQFLDRASLKVQEEQGQRKGGGDNTSSSTSIKSIESKPFSIASRESNSNSNSNSHSNIIGSSSGSRGNSRSSSSKNVNVMYSGPTPYVSLLQSSGKNNPYNSNGKNNSNSSSSSNGNGNGNNSSNYTYGALETNEDDDEMQLCHQQESGSTHEFIGTERNYERHADRTKVSRKSHPIPLVQNKNNGGDTYGGVGKEHKSQFVAGSPLQSVLAYDMPSELMSSYQKRWMQERDTGVLLHHHNSYTHPHSQSQDLSHVSSPQSQNESCLDSTPTPPRSPHVGRRKNSMSDAGERNVTGFGSFRDMLPYPRHVGNPSTSSKSDEARPVDNSSFFDVTMPTFSQIQFAPSGDVSVSVAPVGTLGQRTKSMSQLIAPSSSNSNTSILSAVWSSQERRRERVRHLSTSPASRYKGALKGMNDTDNNKGNNKGKENYKDRERRSKSYDCLGASINDRLAVTDTTSINIEEQDPVFHIDDIDTRRGTQGQRQPISLPTSLTADKGASQGGTEPTEFLILDFSEVLGIDATSARSCFLMLVQLMRSSGVTVVFAAMSPGMESLLSIHGVIRRGTGTGTEGGQREEEEKTDIVISSADGALEWCENQILARGRRGSVSVPYTAYTEKEGGPSSSLRALRKILQEHLEMEEEQEEEEVEVEVEGSGEVSAKSQSPHSLLDTNALSKFFTRHELEEGDIVFDVGQKADSVYFIEAGSVETVLGTVGDARSERVNKISVGGIFGEAAFFLDLPHSVRCVSLCNGCVLWTLTRTSYVEMEISHPQLCLLLQHALLKSLSISSTASLHALHPSAAYSILFE